MKDERIRQSRGKDRLGGDHLGTGLMDHEQLHRSEWIRFRRVEWSDGMRCASRMEREFIWKRGNNVNELFGSECNS